MDEPSGNLDAQAEENLGQQLRQLARTHTVVIVTHSPQLLPLCDSITVLAKGQIAMAGRTDQILPKLMQARNEAKVLEAKPSEAKPSEPKLGENKIGVRAG